MRFVLYRFHGNVALGALKQDVLFGPKAGSVAPPDLRRLLAAGPEAMQKTYDSLLQGCTLSKHGGTQGNQDDSDDAYARRFAHGFS